MPFTYPYPRPAVTVDAIVTAPGKNQLHILLVRRRHAPFAGFWALPGGFVDMDETLESACKRELAEETALRIESLEQFRVFDAIDRDPRGRTISVVFYSRLPMIPEVRGGDDATEARWFPAGNLPGLAFDHRDIIERFLSDRKTIL